MYPLFESIKVIDGRFINLDWHQKRVDSSCNRLYGFNKLLDLQDLTVPEPYLIGVVKCRISYGKTLGSVSYSQYSKRKISTLQQIECEAFKYNLKYQDRFILEYLYGLRGSCDEVLITFKGIIKDTSYSNVVLSDGSDWYTPKLPLLKGTQRAKLLSEGRLLEKKISVDDLPNFEKLVLINAMMEFEEEDYLTLNSIKLWNDPQVVFRGKQR